ncbi:restriction endonuclease [Nocardia sp. GTS18]|uniref:nSTAND3 domain-containing NTPase n=1 Tax=Nocardia sp. GTS18 TaxID=1778064 RepID=UPI0015EFB959|nr:restriction endonuclease [Nocardia sp. GTS18]
MMFAALSDHDFELVLGDLLGAEHDRQYETFARGADGGIDLRHSGAAGVTIVQCKHMEGSTVAQVRSAAKKEAARWANAGEQRPHTYYFVTSRALTPRAKDEFAKTIENVGRVDNFVLAADDLASLIRKYPHVERAHIKLWLSSAEHIRAVVDAGIITRSESAESSIIDSLRLFVPTRSFIEAQGQFLSDRVLVISGPPGIGKSTIAKMLVAAAIADGYSLSVISEDAAEADQVFDHNARQIFFYDNFLGTNILKDRISRNSDKRLTFYERRAETLIVALR